MAENKRISSVGLLLIIMFLLTSFGGKAQTQAVDSIPAERKSIFKAKGAKYIVPAALIAYGVSARFNELPTRRLDFEVDREMRRHFNRKYHIDDYFQIATPVLAYGLGFIPGVKAKHSFRDRTLVVATSLLITEALVQPMKRIVLVTRPEGNNQWSFPSGHTAAAMMGAHLMYKEYKDVSPWIGISGYLMATTTGALRVINHAHWLGDVAMGAGIGLISAEIGYMMLPVWHSVFGIADDKRQIAAFPVISQQNLGLGLVYRF